MAEFLDGGGRTQDLHKVNNKQQTIEIKRRTPSLGAATVAAAVGGSTVGLLMGAAGQSNVTAVAMAAEAAAVAVSAPAEQMQALWQHQWQ